MAAMSHKYFEIDLSVVDVFYLYSIQMRQTVLSWRQPRSARPSGLPDGVGLVI
jgi:hypothetical protein